MNDKITTWLRRHEDTLILVVGLALALWLRYSLRNFESDDFRGFTGKWYDFIVNHGGFRALQYDFANYSPPYLYLLTMATYLFAGIPKVFAIKLISIIFDFGCAFFIYKLVRLKYPTGSIPCFAALAGLFAPTVFLNSSCWGQADVIYTTGLLACLYFLASRQEIPAFIAFGLALAFKLQAIFLAPLLFILLLKGRVSWRSFFIIPLVYFIAILPAWFSGRPLVDLLLIYFNQADTYQQLTKNAPNLYQWFPNRTYEIFYHAGLIWTAALIYLFALSVYKSRAQLTTAIMVELATISVLIMPYFLPKMHERYFFAADVLTIVFAFYFPPYFFVAILIQMVSLFTYLPFLFKVEVIP
ncbi:MAG: hypothetical protein AB1801_23735, partial [Chloroflexota bacterium]